MYTSYSLTGTHAYRIKALAYLYTVTVWSLQALNIETHPHTSSHAHTHRIKAHPYLCTLSQTESGGI